MMSLLEAPQRVRLKVIDIAGGEGARRRLFSLGFHKGDEIECRVRGILGGPVIIKNIRSGVTAAVGRGIARKILVEATDGTR
jgi:Fe2+ transport system protein FeoA